MKLCIFDAWDAADDALGNSHWVAERTADALRRELPDVTLEVVIGDELDGPRVLTELGRPHLGFAYFGHGDERVLYRVKGEPLLGPEQVVLLKDRWLHAFACLSGHSLCHDAAHAGAAAFLGYRVTVVLEWEESTLPDALRDLLATLVTVATLQLAHGEYSRKVILGRVRAASDQLVDWLDVHSEVYPLLEWWHIAGMHTLASLLYVYLEIQGSAVLD